MEGAGYWVAYWSVCFLGIPFVQLFVTSGMGGVYAIEHMDWEGELCFVSYMHICYLNAPARPQRVRDRLHSVLVRTGNYLFWWI